MFHLLVLLVICALPQTVTLVSKPDNVVVVENFDRYMPGDIPRGWKMLGDRQIDPLTDDYMHEERFFVVKEEGTRKFLRAYTNGAVARIVQPNGEGYDWNLRTHPRLRWDWRAVQLPTGAREDRNQLNDTGAALYVTFSMNFLGMPKSIKYSYSSTLPVGSVVSYRGLKVLIVASGKEGYGEWMSQERDVAADYRQLWGGEPPERPLSIMLWSDSNDTNVEAKADFDNIVVLPAVR